MMPKTSGWVTAAALLFSVFAAGALAGAAMLELKGPGPELRGDRGGPGGPGDRRGGPPGRGGRGGPRGMGPGGPVPMLPRGMIEELELTDEQRAAVDQVLSGRREQTEAVLQRMYPLLRAQVDSANAEIRALLTPEQQATFDRIRQQMPEGPPPGGGRGPRPPPPS